MAGTVEDAVAALAAGQPVLLPVDTVYGLCADASRAGPVAGLARLKGRSELDPVALLAARLDVVLELVPELRGRSETLARAILPGPYTLVLPNPARRLGWLAGSRPETIGVRVPELPPGTRAVLDRAGAVAATSANLHGGPDPARLADVPAEIRAACGAELDAGELPGRASTVLDLTGDEPLILRRGGGDVAGALERIRAALA